MKKDKTIGSLVLITLLLAASTSVAGWRGYRGGGGCRMGTAYQRMYNPATVATFSGTIESVNKITPIRRPYRCIADPSGTLDGWPQRSTRAGWRR